MIRHRTVLFDLDGTLLDHFGAIYASHAHTLRQLGLPPPTFAQVRRAVGGGFEAAVRRILGPAHEHLLPQALRIYRDYWDNHLLDGVALLPGARGLLEALKARSVRCAVLTNKNGASAREVCAHLQLASLLDGVFGAFDTPWLKPDAEFVQHALKQLGGDAPTACLIGDSPYDIEAAQNGGFPCYCVATGTHSPEELTAAGATAVYEDLLALATAVFDLNVAAD